jgi:hypothetical protein
MKIQIVPESRFKADAVLAGLPGIDLPGVEIEYSRLLFLIVHLAQHGPGKSVGKKAEIATTTRRQAPVE